MFSFSKNSQTALATCNKDIQAICNELIKIYDFSVIFGYRGAEEQNAAYSRKDSQLKYPLSKHNKKPSVAVDIIPYPGGYESSREQFVYMAGLFVGIAVALKNEGIINHDVRWGGDWNRNNDLKDQSFFDLAHFELIS
jgi:peptidoglycan L-alanyl-D-glutamate endopeptidase CwlK